MWKYIENLNVSLFLNSEDFPNFEHKVSSAWVKGGLILFPANSAYYISVVDEYYNFIDGEYSINIPVLNASNEYMYKRGGSWYRNEDTPRGQKFLVLTDSISGQQVYQNGEYKLNNGMFEPEYMTHSDQDGVNDIPFNNPSIAEVYKSSTLTGYYEWQGEEEEGQEVADLVVGWHSYKHTKLDSEGEAIAGDITVYEQKELTKSGQIIQYNYNGSRYTYEGDFEQSNFVMNNGVNDLTMIFQGLVSYPKSIWKFDGGAQDVD